MKYLLVLLVLLPGCLPVAAVSIGSASSLFSVVSGSAEVADTVAYAERQSIINETLEKLCQLMGPKDESIATAIYVAPETKDEPEETSEKKEEETSEQEYEYYYIEEKDEWSVRPKKILGVCHYGA